MWPPIRLGRASARRLFRARSEMVWCVVKRIDCSMRQNCVVEMTQSPRLSRTPSILGITWYCVLLLETPGKVFYDRFVFIGIQKPSSEWTTTFRKCSVIPRIFGMWGVRLFMRTTSNNRSRDLITIRHCHILHWNLHSTKHSYPIHTTSCYHRRSIALFVEVVNIPGLSLFYGFEIMYIGDGQHVRNLSPQEANKRVWLEWRTRRT